MMAVGRALFGMLLCLANAHPAGADPLAGGRVEESATVPAPTGTVSLRTALAAAEANHPKLTALRWEVRAREAETLQAGLFPNPNLSTEFENFAGTGSRRAWREAETSVSVGQLFLLGGKRLKARTLATAEQRLAAWTYDAERLNVLAQTAKAFVSVLALQERVALATELEHLAIRARTTVAATVRAGAVSPVEESRAAVVVSQAGITRSLLTRELTAAQAALAASWGESRITFNAVTGALHQMPSPPQVDMLLAESAANPDVARWEMERTARVQTLSLEEARRIPDVTVRLGARHFAEGNDGAVIAEMSLPLPFFNRNEGGIAAARARVSAAEAEQALATTTVRSLIVATHQQLVASHDHAESLRRDTIPEAERLHAGAQ